jgi:hypothetical protein
MNQRERDAGFFVVEMQTSGDARKSAGARTSASETARRHSPQRRRQEIHLGGVADTYRGDDAKRSSAETTPRDPPRRRRQNILRGDDASLPVVREVVGDSSRLCMPSTLVVMSWWRISYMDIDGEGFKFLGTGALPFLPW